MFFALPSNSDMARRSRHVANVQDLEVADLQPTSRGTTSSMAQGKAQSPQRRSGPAKGHERVEEPAPTHQLRLCVQNIRHAARAHRDAACELLVEAQQPHGKGGSAEYANRKSDATTAATRAASAGDASRSMMSTTSDVCGPRPERGELVAGRVAVVLTVAAAETPAPEFRLNNHQSWTLPGSMP